jgi:OOP family OmpA-OmpF porin
MKKSTACGISLIFMVILFFAFNAYAENKPGAITLTPHIGGYVFDDDQHINSDPAYGVNLGYNINRIWGIEGVFDFVDTDTKNISRGSTDVDASIFRLDGLYHFNPESDVVPYLGAGLGVIDIDNNPGGSETNGLFNWGGGIKVFITERVLARGDIRHIIDFDSANNNLIYTVGLGYLFGGKVEKKPEMDSDGDGVYDNMDKCPDTPRGVSVNSEGCPLDTDGDGVYDYKDKCPGTPAGVSVDGDGCPLDTDGDGVYDYKDKCPGTPAGVSVDSDGCPLDTDGDGVYDYLDKCPGTLMGIPVDKSGCPLPFKEKVSIELKVEFDFDKATIRSVYDEHLQKVINFLITYPETMAELEGHTDSIGKDAYNLDLSQRRAENVMKYLIDRGVDPSRVKAVGYGESMPIADNATDEGRQRNRRVIAIIDTIITKMRK